MFEHRKALFNLRTSHTECLLFLVSLTRKQASSKQASKQALWWSPWYATPSKQPINMNYVMSVFTKSLM